MNKPLPFFNWSLIKAQDTVHDGLMKARVGIVYTILIFSLLKIIIVITMGAAYGQWLQVDRAVGAFVLYILLFKLLLYRPSRLELYSHVLIVFGILLVWSNIFIYAHKINLLTLQFIFMIALSSFYTLGSAMGLTYSSLSVFPVVLFLVFRGNAAIYLTNTPQEFASPGFEIIVVLNFISIIVAHYLFYHAFQVNVKEKDQLNEQLQLSVAEANKLSASRANFLSTISHELRTPLNSVIGIAELLLDDDQADQRKEHLKILNFSAVELLSLINNVLDFNKIDSDKMVLEAVPFGLAGLVHNLCAALKIKADVRGLSFQLHVDEQLRNTVVISDPTRLSQVIYNLAGNAIKFTDKGSVAVKLECTHKTADTTVVLFSVSDTGAGIHPDRHQAIFELFTQAEAHTTRKYGGTGLGLAIVKRVLTLFNSSVQLESSPGKGARFSFTIPFATTHAAVEFNAPVAPAANIKDITNLKVLVAEDNEVNTLIMKKQLARLGVNAVFVANGQLAYQEYVAGHYDAVFLDLHMPVSGGYDTIKQIRALGGLAKANVYTIAFTASVTEQEKILAYGFNDFLYKPVQMNDLREKLEKITFHGQLLKEGSVAAV